MANLADDLLCGAEAAAAYTGLSVRQIYHLVYAEELPVLRKGRKLFFRKSSLDRAFGFEPA